MKMAALAAVVMIGGIAQAEDPAPAPTPPATSAPADVAAPATGLTYMGQPVTNEWLAATFATYRKNLYKRDGDLINIVDTNFDAGGKTVTPKNFFEPGVSSSAAVDIKGMICQFEGLKVVSPGSGTYLIARDANKERNFILQTREQYINGEALKATTFICIDNGHVEQVVRNMQPVYEDVPPFFAEVKPATMDDFVRYIKSGKKLTASYKSISEDDARLLPETSVRVSEKTLPPKYYKPVFVPAPKPKE